MESVIKRHCNAVFAAVLICYLASSILFITSRMIESQRHGEVLDRLDRIEAKLNASAKDTEEGIDGLHKIHTQRGENIGLIQDTLVMVLHYTQPHKEPVRFCPACAKLVDEEIQEYRKNQAK